RSRYSHEQFTGCAAVGGSKQRRATAFPHTCRIYAIVFVPALKTKSEDHRLRPNQGLTRHLGGWYASGELVKDGPDAMTVAHLHDCHPAAPDSKAGRKSESTTEGRIRACRHLRLMRPIDSGLTRGILKMAEIGFKAVKMGASLESHIVERCPMGTDCPSFAWQGGRSWPVGRGQSAVY